MMMARACVLFLAGCGRVAFDAASDAKADDAALDPALLAYWPFDVVGAGNITNDVTGNGHHAQLQSSALSPGLLGQGVDVGPGRYATVPTLRPTGLGGADVTVSLCVAVASNRGEFDMPFYMGGGNVLSAGIDLELGFNSWGFSVGDGDGVNDDVLLAIGDASLAGSGFHCYAVRLDRSARLATAFRDGAVTETRSLAGLDDVFPTGPALRFNGDTSGQYEMDGVIDEVRIYLRALADDEIRALHPMAP